MTYLSNQQSIQTKGEERRRRSQPPARGCPRERATLGNEKSFIATLKGWPRRFRRALKLFANSFRVHSRKINAVTQGVALSWNLQTPSALTRRHQQMIRQLYEWLWERVAGERAT